MDDKKRSYTAFVGARLIDRGELLRVVLATKSCVDEGGTDRVAFYDDATGAPSTLTTAALKIR